MNNHDTISNLGNILHKGGDFMRTIGSKALVGILAGAATFGVVGCSSGEKTIEHKTVSVACSDPGTIPQVEGVFTEKYNITEEPRRGTVEAGCPGGDIGVTGINDGAKPKDTTTPTTTESPAHTLTITALCSRSDTGFKTRVINTPGKGAIGNNIFKATIEDCSIESAVIDRDPS